MRQKYNPISSMKHLKGVAALFMVCPFLYLGILFFVRQSGALQSPDPDVLPKLTGILALIFLGQIGFAYFFPRLLSQIKTPGELFENYRNVVIVQLAMLESGAIFGLVLGFMGAEMIVPICFSIASLFFVLNIFPSEAKMERFGRQ